MNRFLLFARLRLEELRYGLINNSVFHQVHKLSCNLNLETSKAPLTHYDASPNYTVIIL